MLVCKIKVKTRIGTVFSYRGIFKTTCDAAMDAILKFNPVNVYVTAEKGA